MSCWDTSHTRRCGLCAKFQSRQSLNVYDFEAEPLAAECPYYHLQQGLVELFLDPEPARWRVSIRWEPISCRDIGYMAAVSCRGHKYEYCDVYLEPGEHSTIP